MIKTTVDVGRKLTRSNRILIETAANYGINIEKVPGEKRRFRMDNGNKDYLIRRGQIVNSYNNRLALKMCRQKDVTSRYLIGKGFPSPENATFYSGEENRAWNWAKEILPIVLKPVDGALGDMVYVNINDKDEFIDLFQQVVKKYNRVLVEKFCKGNDHRILVVKNKVVGIITRVPARVFGNGINTIEQLLNQKNNSRKKHPVLKQIKVDDDILMNLEKFNYMLDSIPEKDEIVYLKNNANISDGADSYEVMDQVSDDLIEMAQNAIKSIPGLNVCGMDMLIDEKNVGHIIELNGNPMLDVHHYTTCGNGVDVAKTVVQAMFPQK